MKKQKFITKSLLGMFFTLMLLSGCGTMVAYDGPTQPKENIAVIKTPSALKELAQTAHPSIRCIDGKSVPGSNSGIEVLPGKHQIEISFQYSPSWGATSGFRYFVGSLDFEAQAGHEYIANGVVASSQPLIWLEDNNTQQVAAREVAVDTNSIQNYEPCSLSKLPKL